ncbi:hypothetical protein P154DRAFT_548979 [Amniculicola lignicola CBS 123094]|uniref:PAC domain-containing protein n=1 Tax=Amniculicola lignicola CBS 123094 TaxID=1392246 RepID=A0A6A5W017_9PLEO|nr:hypothetical protein P154DRAFT_548979 [Amniculicola lignicola CBS 123094]
MKRLSLGQASAYDLKPPPPRVSHDNAELIADRLFSTDHLNLILKDPALSQRFTTFLNQFRPQSAPTLVRYLETQKALTAIRYANALVEQMSSRSGSSSTANGAAQLDAKFEHLAQQISEELVTDALPAYITYRMVSVVTECLVKEVTGSNTPLMREMVQGLAEVYCMSDPSLPDNPICFASDEFYNTTQYGREYVIGKNCRFLQGPKTQSQTVKRISEALQNGQEICETLLNYRRDGSPFLNLAMMAPLMDHKGAVRYFLGCQIDISHLLEGGRGLESLKMLLARDLQSNKGPFPDPVNQTHPVKILKELGTMLNDEEAEALRNNASEHNTRPSFESGASTPTARSIHSHHHPTRRFVGMDEPSFETEPPIWPPSQFGPSGRLPGVYQNYLLVRPYPSLRIIFTSAALRIPGLSMSRLMDRVAGPQHVREGLESALAAGVGVTAKVSWLTQSRRNGQEQGQFGNANGDSSDRDSNALDGKPRWIHCTHLLGSDSKPGVIMIVMVDKEEITGHLNPSSSSPSRIKTPVRTGTGTGDRGGGFEGWPLKGMGGSAASAKFTSAKLYAEYLRREGREERSLGGRVSIASEASRRSGRGSEEVERDGGSERGKRATSKTRILGF